MYTLIYNFIININYFIIINIVIIISIIIIISNTVEKIVNTDWLLFIAMIINSLMSIQ